MHGPSSRSRWIAHASTMSSVTSPARRTNPRPSSSTS
jgi:hypothetical protein